MNTRRDFFKQLAVGAASFAILPSATTYERIWKPRPVSLGKVLYELNPEWCRAAYEIRLSWDYRGVTELLVGRKPGEPSQDPKSIYPVRFTLTDGSFKRIPPFIKVEL